MSISKESLFKAHQNIVNFFKQSPQIGEIVKEVMDYYNTIIRYMPGNVYWLDKDCLAIGCNQNVLDMFRLKSVNEFFGLSFEQMAKLGRWEEGQAISFKKDTVEVIRSGKAKPNVEEPPIPGLDGNQIYFLTTRVPLFNNQSEVIGVVGISTDITHRKYMEQELIKTKEKAESANRAKTEFLANMSHDMKTPLAGIVTTAEVIASDQNAPERNRQFASIISDSGKQLASFFTSCLDLSQMEMEEWASNTAVFSIKKLLNDVHALFLPKAMSNHLLLQIEYDETLPKSVEGHRDSLYRVLLNLVGNAIKFTEKGSVTLRAKMLKKADEKHISVEFQVQDTGMGIPEDKHKVIFEKLRRLKPSYESQIEGSGIGLYIVDQYVKRMNGSIQIDSKVGDGSTFTVTLSFKIVSDKAIESSTAAQSTEDVTAKENVRMKISCNVERNNAREIKDIENLPRVLVVEDTDVIQFITKSLLNTAGFSVDIASTGEEAVDMFEPGKYDLIYMDIGLPTMSGYDAVRAVREKEKALNATTQIPIIALTGHGAVDIQAFCGEAGMQGILSKPLSRVQAEKVWQHFKKKDNVSVPGLTLLTNTTQPSDNEILDVEATIKIIGVKDIAENLIATLVEDLKNQFLPHIKIFISEHKYDALKFLLHQQLGSLAYAKAPRLEKKLSELQAMVRNGINIDQAAYQEIEKEVLRVVESYEKRKSGKG